MNNGTAEVLAGGRVIAPERYVPEIAEAPVRGPGLPILGSDLEGASPDKQTAFASKCSKMIQKTSNLPPNAPG